MNSGRKYLRDFLGLAALTLSLSVFSEPAEDRKISPSSKNLFEGQIAPLLEGMGTQGFAISSPMAKAKAFFNQAVALTYGFNHLEA